MSAINPPRSDPSKYEDRLREIFEKIIKSPKARLVQ